MLKLQLDSSALGQLLEGNDEGTIELRNYVVQEAAKKYLKSVLNTELVQEAKKAAVRETSEVLTEYFTLKTPGFSNKVALAPKVSKEIQSSVRALAGTVVTEEVNKRLDGLDVAALVSDTLAKVIDARVSLEVSKRIAAWEKSVKDIKY